MASTSGILKQYKKKLPILTEKIMTTPLNEHVQVVVRFRPRGALGVGGDDSRAITILDHQRVNVTRSSSTTSQKRATPRVFRFDRIFPPETQQSEVFEQVMMPMVDSALQGYNGTVMAYGATGSGKSFT